MLENEAVFRRYNERVQHNFREIITQAREAGQEYLVKTDDTALHFYCECSDENCRDRIQMKPSLYDKIHLNRRHFIVLPGHDTVVVERVVRYKPKYSIVEKDALPPETAKVLSPTGVDNV